jgi:hypothetical protein
MSMNGQVWRDLTDSPDILEGIASGRYNVFGGVIRHAAGSLNGGQIVGHLKFPGSQQLAQQSIEQLQTILNEGFASIQEGVGALQQNIDVLQGLQVANLALSGLNLAVSVAGFAIVCRKLNGISSLLHAQSKNIDDILELAKESRNRSLLGDEAKFRALVSSARQFCDTEDALQLKQMIMPINHEYEFTKLVLEQHAAISASNIFRLDEIGLLQDRLVNIGLMRSHVQMKIGSFNYAKEALDHLNEDLTSLNKTRVHTLSNKESAFSIPEANFGKIISFLEQGKILKPALTYQADLLDLETKRPGSLILTPNNISQILVLAA